MEVPPPHESRDLHAFVLGLGRALSQSGAAVSETEERLLRIAAAAGARDARIVVLPTAIMIAFGQARWTAIEAIRQTDGTLRLDQISALYDLVSDAERGKIEPGDGLDRLDAIRTMVPRYPKIVAVLGYAVMTAGLCLLLQPTWADVGIATALGAAVGALIELTRGQPRLIVLVPVLAATAVSAASFELVKRGIADPGLRTLIAPLVLFLPGAVLTTATQELTAGEMVAGSSRLVYGMLQLLLLAFGIVAGVELSGLPTSEALTDDRSDLLGWWAPWLGVLVFGVAVSVHLSAPRGSLRYLIIVLFSAWIGQLLGKEFVGAGVSAFFGALAMTPIALALARLPGGPPSQVTFLPAFWMLVPGALGLIGVTEVISDPAHASIDDLLGPLTSILSIALGVMVGLSLFHGAVTAPRAIPSRLRFRR